MTKNQQEQEQSPDNVLADKIKDFGGLLNSIKNLDEKKQHLWMEIYENAINDRQHSYAMFMKLVGIVGDKSSEHAVHGKTMSSYIERMSKANDQLIRLADLIAQAEEKNDAMDVDDVFSKIRQ